MLKHGYFKFYPELKQKLNCSVTPKDYMCKYSFLTIKGLHESKQLRKYTSTEREMF